MRRSRSRRLIACAHVALVVALGWLGTQTAAAAHDAVARHALCVEHGAIEELATTSGQSTAGVNQAGLAGDAHDDCLFAALGTITGHATQVVVPAVSTVPALLPRTLLPRPVHRTARVWRLAPKTDPPHLA